MKLSKKQTLEKCRDMWQWLAERPNEHKVGYFMTGKQFPPHPSEVPVNLCYACEYTAIAGYVFCSTCPLLNLWCPGLSPVTASLMQIEGNCPCEQSESTYYKWIHADISDKGKYAQEIADYCTLLLEKEGKDDQI